MKAQDLLNHYLSYYPWSGENVYHDLPSQIRRQRLESLLHAFGLTRANANYELTSGMTYSYKVTDPSGEEREIRQTREEMMQEISDIHYFERGEFLSDRPKEENQELIEIVQDHVRQTRPSLVKDMMTHRIYGVRPRSLFSSLLRFRKRIYALGLDRSMTMEGFSPATMYGEHLKQAFQQHMMRGIDKIDETLCLLIDPKRRTIDREVLINYPYDDLETIDREWRFEHF